MYVCAHTHIHCYITGLFGRRILFGSLLQFTPGGEGEAAAALASWRWRQRCRCRGGGATAPARWRRRWCGLVLESQSHSVGGGCANSSGATTPNPLWQSATEYVCVFVTFKCNLCNSRRGRGRGSAASRANRLYSHSLLHATVQFTVGLLEHAASYA